MPRRDLTQALALLEKKGAFTLSELCAWVAGEEIRGSWWSHPAGREIFAVADGLEHSGGVLVCKLKGAKVTFVHERLWPALLRVVTDAAFRASRVTALSPSARALLAKVEAEPVRTDLLGLEKKQRTKLQTELEASWLVHARSEHTESGRHATVLQRWEEWAPAKHVKAARKLPFDDARDQLAAAGLTVERERR